MDSAQAAIVKSAQDALVQHLSGNPESLFTVVASNTTEEFVDWFVTYLRSILDLEFVFVGELRGEDWERVKTLSVDSSKGLQPSLEYELRGTPCADVLAEGTCCYPEGVCKLYPEDLLLAQMGVESYVGMALQADFGRPIGIVVALDIKPIDVEKRCLAEGTFAIFKNRLECILRYRRAREEHQQVMANGANFKNVDPLHQLSAALAQTLNVRAAFVQAPVRSGEQSAEVLSFGSCGLPKLSAPKSLPNFHHGSGPVFIQQQLRQQFSDDAFLNSMAAESVLIQEFFDPQGVSIGSVGVLHDRELHDEVPANSLFNVFAARIASELERRHNDEIRQDLQSQLLEVQKHESLGLLAGGIAHDFNNLLCSILGNAELGSADLASGMLDRKLAIQNNFSEIIIASERAAELCAQMLAYSGKGRLESRNIDYNNLIAELVALLRASCSKKVEFKVKFAPDLPHVRADGAQLQQLVLNLLKNAADSIEDDTGEIEVETWVAKMGPAEFLGTYGGQDLESGEYIGLKVRDTGLGMSAETLSRVFEPFFTTKEKGHGLGLSALLGIIGSHKGAIRVESVLGGGSTFNVFLPVGGGEAESVEFAVDSIQETPDQEAAMGRVLLADDEESVLRLVRSLLQREGYEVVVAANGVEAILRFAEDPESFACAVMDLSMPQMGGEQAVQELRRLNPEIPVVLMSGFPTLDILDRLEGQVFSGVLNKPFTGKELVHRVGQAVRSCAKEH